MTTLSHRGAARSVVVALAAVLLGHPATAQATWQDGADQTQQWPINPETAPRPVAPAVRAAGEIKLDGRLDEPAWRDAIPISEFIQSQPQAGYPATEPTVVRILYDDRNLYVGAICYDSEPDRLTVTSLERDFPGGSTRDMDIFAVTLDTFLDRRNSFMFLVNPHGAFRDGQTFNDSRQLDLSWRGVVEIRTAIHDSGWTVEMAIPWTTLRFDPTRDEQRWGMNLLRRVRRKNEDSYWAPVDRRNPVHRMSTAGTLEGLKGMRPGRNLRVKPYAVAEDVSGELQPPADDRGGFRELLDHFDAGLDLKYGITPRLTLDATYRTDFSQVEVDQERINLTRFPLFFPERRDFFVENSGSFVLGDVTERNYRMGSSLRDFTLFHSRRIGLSPDRRPIAILGDGRLTGRAGEFEIGLLDVQTQAFESNPAENFGVFRVRRNLGGSDVGVIFINRQATGAVANGEYNRSYAADANLRLFDHMIVNSYVTRTDEPGADGDQTAARLSVAWRDRIWDASGFVKHVGDAFNPGVGFVRRRGIRHGYATFGAHPRPRLPLVQEINPYGELHYVTDLESVLQTRNATLGFRVEFLDGSGLGILYQNSFERLEEPFTISGFEIPVGEYHAQEASAAFMSSRGRPFWTAVNLTGGDYWNGSRLSLGLRALWRVSYHLSFDVSASHNDVSLRNGSFTADVFGTRIRYAYSTSLFGSAFVQYNSEAKQLVTNLRLNWMHAPLSDVFLVYTERRDVENNVVLDRVVTAKVTKLLAF